MTLTGLIRLLPAIPLIVLSLGLVGSTTSEFEKFRKSNGIREISKGQAGGAAEFRAGHFENALAIFRRTLPLAQQSREFELAVRLQNNIGSAQFALFQYQNAIQSYLKARNVAQQHGYRMRAGVIDINLASLYMSLGDWEGANRATSDALRMAGNSDLLGFRYQLLDCIAELRALEGRKAEAVVYYKLAIPAADRAGDTNAMARIWDHLGMLWLVSGDLASAEGPLFEEFRLRSLFRDRDLKVSYVHLAWLRIDQKDFRSAAALLEHAKSMPATDAGEPPYFLKYLRGRVAEGLGESQAALADYSEAFREGLECQKEVGPADSLRSMSVTREQFHRIYEAVAETSLKLEPAPAVQAFEATELYRAAALRETLLANPHWLRDAPASYWVLLDRLRVAQIAEMNQHSESNRASIAELRQELAELQGEYNDGSPGTSEKNTARLPLKSIQGSLRPEEALFSFYLGERSSVVWAVSQERIEKYPLAGRRTLETLAGRFRAAVEGHRSTEDATTLYRALFQNLNSEFRDKRTWIISTSDVLFSIPFAGLEVERRGNQRVYLGEMHTILNIPSAMLNNQADPIYSRQFVGVGDGIYNSADSRYRPAGTLMAGLGALVFWNGRYQPTLQLPRLVGSGPEIDGCARTWGRGDAVLLKGTQASSVALESALESHPAVVHLAVHVIAPSNGRPEESAIDLGLTAAGQPDILTRDDIATLHATGATVVMSGCSSAAGRAISGVGVAGLTRAWLLAGARVVVGSRWPTADDTGELFQSFYQHLRDRLSDPDRTRAVAKSLHDAQVEMLHSHTWRSDPWYWSAFYVLGKE